MVRRLFDHAGRQVRANGAVAVPQAAHREGLVLQRVGLVPVKELHAHVKTARFHAVVPQGERKGMVGIGLRHVVVENLPAGREAGRHGERLDERAGQFQGISRARR